MGAERRKLPRSQTASTSSSSRGAKRQQSIGKPQRGAVEALVQARQHSRALLGLGTRTAAPRLLSGCMQGRYRLLVCNTAVPRYCRRDDLWIISNNPELQPGFPPGQPGDRSREPWVVVARSLWHAPNQDGK